MVMMMSILLAAFCVSALVGAGLVWVPIARCATPLFPVIMVCCTAASIPLELAWNKSSFRGLVFRCLGIMVYSILIYAALYHHSGLVVEGIQAATPSWLDAIYFSGMTWTTVGFGDVAPASESKLYAVAEALTAYITMALLMAVVILWIDEAKRNALVYRQWLDNASQEDIEKATGISLKYVDGGGGDAHESK